jgi:hypothetical protein
MQTYPEPIGIGQVPSSFDCPQKFTIRAVSTLSLPTSFSVGKRRSLKMDWSYGPYFDTTLVFTLLSYADRQMVRDAVKKYLEGLVASRPGFCSRGLCSGRREYCKTSSSRLATFEPLDPFATDGPPGIPVPGVAVAPGQELASQRYNYTYEVDCDCYQDE